MHVVAGQGAGQAAQAGVDAHDAGAVVDAVDGGQASHGDVDRRDVDGDARDAGDVVVAGVGAGQHQSAQRHWLAGADMLVEHLPLAQAGAGDIDLHVIASQHVAAGGARIADDVDLHAGAAVVGAVNGGDAGQAADVEVARRDASGGAGAGAGQRVVAGVGAAQADAADADGEAVADVLARESGRLAHAHAVAADDAGEAARDRRGGRAVVDTGAAAVAGGECARRDVGAGAAGAVEQRIVDRVGTGKRAAADVDCQAVADVLARGEAAAAADGDDVAAEDVERAAGQRGAGRAVIDLVHAGPGGGEVLRPDADRDAAGRGDAVVGRVGAAQHEAGHRDRLVAAGVLVQHRADGRAIGRAGDRDQVAGDDVGLVQRHRAGVADVDRHAQGAVVVARLRRHAGEAEHADRPGRDRRRRRGAAAAAEAVVGGVAALQRDRADAHGLVRAGVLVAEHCRAAQAHAVAGDQAGQGAVDRRGQGAVIDATAALPGGGHGLGRDVGHRRAAGVEQRVVARVGAGQRASGDRHLQAGAGVLARDEDAAAADADRVARDEIAGAAQQRGGVGAVVDLVLPREGGGDRFLRDRDGHALRCPDGVVAGIGTGQCQTRHGHRLVAADVLVGDGAGGDVARELCDIDIVAADHVAAVQADGAAAALHVDLHRGRAVVVAAARAHAGQAGERERARCDRPGGAGGGAQQAVVGGIGAGQRNATHRDRLAGADVLGRGCAAGEEPRATHRDVVPGDEVVAALHRRVGRAVIDAAAAGEGGGQEQPRHVGAGAARGGGEHIVDGIGARQQRAGHVDRLGRADVLAVGEEAAAADGDAVARDQPAGRARDTGAGVAVVDAVHTSKGGGHGQRRDVHAHARGADDGVVDGVAARERQAIDGDGLVVADVLVGHRAADDARGRHVDLHVVTWHDVGAAGRERDTHRHRDVDRAQAVVDAVLRRHVGQAADRDRLGGDAAGGAGAETRRQQVVAGVGAAERDVAYRDRLAVADVLAVSEQRGLRGAELIAADHVAQVAEHAGAGAAVVDLALAAEVDAHRARRDVGAGAAAGVEQRVVVARRAGQEGAADVDRQAGADVLAGCEQACGGDAHAAGIDGQEACRTAADHRRGVAVVDLVGSQEAGVHRQRRDVHRQARGAHRHVVACRAAGERDAGDVDGLVVAGVAVGHRAEADAARRQHGADLVAADHVAQIHRGVGGVHRDRGGAVVDTVGGGDAGHAQLPRHDRCGGAGAGVAQRIVASLRPGERDAADGHGLVGADRSVAGEKRRLRQADRIAGDELQRVADHRRAGVEQAVVDAAAAGVGHRHQFGCDAAGGGGSGAGE